MRNISTDPWNVEDLDNAIKRLKLNKSRDPHGFINEIFKEEYMGKDLKLSLLSLFNEIKNNLVIPTFMNRANITSIHKKGSRYDMDNQRGIFGLSVFKKIAEYLIFEDLYKDIDKGMSDSNIGGRKKRMAKDHLFVVYGIINDVVNGKSEPIDIRVKDIEKAFDKLWLQDTLNDLCDTIPKEKHNNKISLLFELNRSTNVAIKTPNRTKEF